jgi:hypothetical protein
MKTPVEKPIPIMYIEYDGTGIPMTGKELSGRKGKQRDGGAKTREVKLGCIFTQTTTDDEGRPVRDKNTTSYFGAIESSEEFGDRVYANAILRGAAGAKQVAVIGDSAKWIWNLASRCFPGAIQIVDLYHAREHVWGIVRKVCPDPDGQEKLKVEWFELLEAGDIKELAEAIKSHPSAEQMPSLR